MNELKKLIKIIILTDSCFIEILKLVLSGRMGQAIDQTLRSYPGLLESNQNLLFMLKCRQFVEMVNGCDFDVSTIQINYYITCTTVQKIN